MQTKTQNLLKKLSKKLNSQTNTCKICLKNFEDDLLNETLFQKISICEKCYQEMNLSLIKLSIDGIKGYAIYDYNEKIKSMIYLLKGCGDIEMAPVFLERIKVFVKMQYKDYILIPAPSWIEDDHERGFNHVVEMFKNIELPIVPYVLKKTNFKQSSSSVNERKKIIEKFGINEQFNLKNKKVLIVDDVFTSGSTVKSLISIIKKAKPRKMNFLVIAAVCRKM